MHTVEVSEGSVEELRGDTDSVCLQENTNLDGWHVPGTPEVIGNPRDLLEAVGVFPEVWQYRML